MSSLRQWSAIHAHCLVLPLSLSFGAGGKDNETGQVAKGWGYYEVSVYSLSASKTLMKELTLGPLQTIAGGSGAGPGWNGTSGVHCHMTNTRITDPEIMERRYRKS